ncbi:MAG: conserved membrane protein of unknown function [Nitrosopumilales archaeon]|nr:MAG: conserved membrane protein of unknown function [Nitrosopumilales archaeon]
MDKIESSPKTYSTHKWSNLFIIVGLAQFVAVGVLTVIIVLSHMGPEPVLSIIMTYTDAEFTPGLWFTFGYQMYILGSIAVLVFGFVYRHIENMSENPYNKKTNFLAGFHLVTMNVGLVVSTFTFMIAGWITGIAMVGEDFGGKGMATTPVHFEIFMTLVPLGTPHWVGIWILVMAVGIILGSISLISRLRK